MKTDDVIIAEYMGFQKNIFEPEFYILPPPFNNNGPFCSCEFLCFSSDWNWLMAVVQKISKEWEFMHPNEEKILEVINLPLSTQLNEAYDEVVKYIRWRIQPPTDKIS